MTLKELLVGFGTQVRSIWMIGLHAFAKRETRMYPEEPVTCRRAIAAASC
ncbi:NADH dehydrogenase subunit I [Klebsiella pneumoniae]|uniref:NADH dehydrogenase subunit I n=1 Tax=Klebsiella pneumoniae TaxID=573 RepID=A0A2X3KI37_KLEPN|nr:NADH dehydrogenase subunit I [Klebsiella pneumoniae]